MVLKPADQLKKRIQELEEENDSLNQSLRNQLVEIGQLTKDLEQVKSLENSLKKEKQKKKEQEKRIQQMENEASEAAVELSRVKNGDVKHYQEKLAKSSNEAVFLNKTIRAQEKELSSARQQIKQLTADTAAADAEISRRVSDIALLNTELEAVKKSVPSADHSLEMQHANASFKQFVKVKRELSQLSSENRKLKARLQKGEMSRQPSYMTENMMSATISETLGIDGFTNIGLGAVGLLSALTIDLVDILGEPVQPKCWMLVEFDDLVQMIRHGCVQLFDVREREEVKETGMIPEAVNLPLSELEEALSMNKEEFETKYDVTAPHFSDLDIVTSCKSGMRSKTAMRIFHKFGYKYVRTYGGSFNEYSTNKSHIHILPRATNMMEKDAEDEVGKEKYEDACDELIGSNHLSEECEEDNETECDKAVQEGSDGYSCDDDSCGDGGSGDTLDEERIE